VQIPRLAFGSLGMTKRILAGIAAILALGAALTGNSSSSRPDIAALAKQIEREDDHVTALELAQWIKDRKPGLRVIDIRSDSEFTEMHIPGAERLPLEKLASLKPKGDETLVLYSEGGAHAAQGWVLLRSAGFEKVYFLKGGLLDWLDDLMSHVITEA
jgi:rhodanese-related sulfurtransferase